MAKGVRIHVVAKGETLDKIAKKYKIPSWKMIYDDPANAKLRKLRDNPDRIIPGDKIVIQLPGLSAQSAKSLDALISMLRARIAKIEALKSDGQKTTRQLTGEIKRAASKTKKVGEAADLAAAIIFFLKDLTKLTMKGWKAMQLSGRELDAANKAFTKEFIKFEVMSKKDLLADPVYGAVRKSGKLRSDKPILEGAMIAYDSWLNLTSPSFWGKTYVKLDETGFLNKLVKGRFSDAWGAWSEAVTWDPQAEFKKGIRHIESQQKGIDARLNKMINEDTKLLEQLVGLRKSG